MLPRIFATSAKRVVPQCVPCGLRRDSGWARATGSGDTARGAVSSGSVVSSHRAALGFQPRELAHIHAREFQPYPGTHAVTGVRQNPDRHRFQLFPSASLALLHSFEVPYRSLVSDNQLSRDFGVMEEETIRGFIAQAALPQSVKSGIVTLVEHGHPSEMLGRYAADHDIDLTVIGAYERGRLFHYLVGGQGPRILEAVLSDVLVVRPRRGS